MLIVVLGLVTLLTFRSDRKGPELEAERKTALALAQAKAALLGNSATNNITGGKENPGRLPCPNINSTPSAEGSSAGLSGSGSNVKCATSGAGIPNNMGRFPWKSLKLDDLRDGASERLWYVVDPEFIDTGKPMNFENLPTLTINGVNKVVAVIIAPGASLGALNQQRDATNQDNYQNYLESYVNEQAMTLSTSSTNYNDRMLTVTARELFNVVTERMIRELLKKLEENGLVSPYPSSYPSMPRRMAATEFDPPPADTWFDNNWDSAVSDSYSSTSTQFTLQFANCASVFTVTRTGTSNTISRAGSC